MHPINDSEGHCSANIVPDVFTCVIRIQLKNSLEQTHKTQKNKSRTLSLILPALVNQNYPLDVLQYSQNISDCLFCSSIDMSLKRQTHFLLIWTHFFTHSKHFTESEHEAVELGHCSNTAVTIKTQQVKTENTFANELHTIKPAGKQHQLFKM